MNAVCTTFGCCVAAAAPTADAVGPFVFDSWSPFVIPCDNGPRLRSVTGLLNAGGLIVDVDVIAGVCVGVMSIGSTAAGLGELFAEDEGRIGIDLRLPEAKGSVNGLRDISAVAAIGDVVVRNGLGRGRGGLNECGYIRGDMNRSRSASGSFRIYVNTICDLEVVPGFAPRYAIDECTPRERASHAMTTLQALCSCLSVIYVLKSRFYTV